MTSSGNQAFIDGAEASLRTRCHRAPIHGVRQRHRGPPSSRSYPTSTSLPFEAFDRDQAPPWLLQAMLRSGLFEDERTRVATAVTWFYEGPGGTFVYWPDGPDADPVQVEAPYGNVGVVGDNEIMFHGVTDVGTPSSTMPRDLTRDAELCRTDGGWEIHDGDRPLISYSDAEVRITVSWKAEIFTDQGALDLHDSHAADLTVPAVVDRFCDDLTRRGVDHVRPDNPLDAPDFVEVLAHTYPAIPPSLGG